MEPETEHNLDLPLMANIESIKVNHYIINLKCDMEKKRFTGFVILLCTPVRKHNESCTKGTDKLNEVNTDNSQIESELDFHKSNTECDLVEALTRKRLVCLTETDKKSLIDVTSADNVHKEIFKVKQSSGSNTSCDCGKTAETSNNTSDIPTTISEQSQETCLSRETDFCMILDAWDLNVHNVSEIDIPEDCEKAIEMGLPQVKDKNWLMQTLPSLNEKSLEFICEKTCLKIWKPGSSSALEFPKAVKIYYQTKTDGPSLKWTVDQDGRPCVYTHGHWINNRSLFPSQDVPQALATWDAVIQVPDDMVVLMSGDQNAQETEDNGMHTFRYMTNLEVPSSTLALAVGYWKQVNLIDRNPSSSQLPCRLFTPQKYLQQSTVLIGPYIPKCMESAYALLGPHPFRRLDILIVPSSFNSLGMASPSLMFLSQSVLSDDGHMLIRVAHELSHSWFGLAIGPLDWHEEWLSEGFCTYTEALIHSGARQLSPEAFKMEREIMDHLKFRILSSELQYTDPGLQKLRHNVDSGAGSFKYVHNGMNPDKGFLQLHYLKGYFLLKEMEEKVGVVCFHRYLRSLVETYLHQLIDSKDVLRLYFETFPDVRNDEFSEEIILEKWLNSPYLPKIPEAELTETGNLVKAVLNILREIREFNSHLTCLHWRKRRKLGPSSRIKLPSMLCIPQTMLLLDRLLEEKKIHREVLDYLNDHFRLSSSNADVRHKWCELVIKHKHKSHYEDVRSFLLDDQAMGVYLFGELVISRDRVQRALAEDCFRCLAAEMEDGVKDVVSSMIYGQ